MANWAWPHTPEDNMARILLTGGPFDGETAFFVPPDISVPAQIVWSGWFPWGLDAWLYEWMGEKTMDRGRTDALIYRPTGRRLGPDEIPYAIAEAAETYVDASILLASIRPLHPKLRLPKVEHP